MREISNILQRWTAADKRFAVATVVQTWGSAPRGVGSVMAIAADKEIAGSVSGGCVETAVIEAALDVLKNNTPRELRFGVSDEKAWSVGLTCGGQIRVFVEPHLSFSENPADAAVWTALRQAHQEFAPAILMLRLEEKSHGHLLVYPGGKHVGDWGDKTAQAIDFALQAYGDRRSQEGVLGNQPVFAQVFPRRDQLLIIGAAHIAIPLVRLARDHEFEITVIDPRGIFLAENRFPDPPDHILQTWPQDALADLDLHEDTYAVVLSHDPKIDDVALRALLVSPARYIGALGSRGSHQKRCQRLRGEGLADSAIARIHAPVGLDIQARTPEEIALSIMAQMIAVRRSI